MGQCWPKACDDCASIASSDLGLTDDDEMYELLLPYPILKRVESYGHLKVNNKVGNVFDFYHEVKVIGEGSMGSVSKVRRKMQKFGQSSRWQYHANTRVTSNDSILQRNEHTFTSHHEMEDSWQYTTPLEKDKQSLGSRPRRVQRQIRSTNDLLSLATGDEDLLAPPSDFHEYALKSINFDKVNDESVLKEMRNEIEILRELDHPNIVKPIETYESPNQIYIVCELLSGGDLYSRDPYSEKDAVNIVGKLLSAVAFMHRNHIIHRDLKFENVMFENHSEHAEIKVIDFGLSKRYSPSNPSCTEGVGTIYSMAPQVFQGKYTSQADCWSIGVITFMLLSSNLPFFGESKSDVVKKILRCDYAFNNRRWLFVSDEAKTFVRNLLQYNPSNRKTAKQASRSEWLKKKFLPTKRQPEQDFLDHVQAALENFSRYGKLKKVALIVIAHTSTLAEVINLRRAFNSYDTENSGIIGYTHFKRILKEYFYSEAEIDLMFQAVDVDKRGVIHYTEFLAATLEVHGIIDENKVSQVFHRFDKSVKGYLVSEDVRQILGHDTSDEEIDACMMEADFDCDGKISYDDFRLLFEDQLRNVIENVEKIALRRRLSLTNLQAGLNMDTTNGFPTKKNLSVISSKPSSCTKSDASESYDNDDISIESGLLF